MSFIDQDGRLLRTSAALSEVRTYLSADPRLTNLRDLEVSLQRWGSVGIHLRGRWAQTEEPVVVKVGTSPHQLWWMQALAKHAPELVPRLYAWGHDLGGCEVGWVVMEWIDPPTSPSTRRRLSLLLEAGVRFQAVARTLEGPATPVTEQVVRSWLEQGIERSAPGPPERIMERFSSDWAWLLEVCGRQRCHGDLHLSNVLFRPTGRGQWRGVLIDFETSLMPWPFEAAWPQILNSLPHCQGCRRLVIKMAHLRQAAGLAVPSERAIERVSTLVLGWFALRVWGLVGPHPDPTWRPHDIWRRENERYIEHLATLKD